MEDVVVELLSRIDYLLVDKHDSSLPDDPEIIRLIHNAIASAYDARGTDQYQKVKSLLDDARFNAKAARYCAAVIWGRHNDYSRVKDVPLDNFQEAELKAEEWCSMYIDGPDVGASWDRFELEQDEAGIHAKGVDERGELEIKVNVGPVKGSVYISKEMWEDIGKKFK